MHWSDALGVLGIVGSVITAIELAVKGYGYVRANKKRLWFPRANSTRAIKKVFEVTMLVKNPLSVVSKLLPVEDKKEKNFVFTESTQLAC